MFIANIMTNNNNVSWNNKIKINTHKIKIKYEKIIQNKNLAGIESRSASRRPTIIWCRAGLRMVNSIYQNYRDKPHLLGPCAARFGANFVETASVDQTNGLQTSLHQHSRTNLIRSVKIEVYNM